MSGRQRKGMRLLHLGCGLMSCPRSDGELALVAEGQCLWAKIGGRRFEQDRTLMNIGGKGERWSRVCEAPHRESQCR